MIQAGLPRQKDRLPWASNFEEYYDIKTKKGKSLDKKKKNVNEPLKIKIRMLSSLGWWRDLMLEFSTQKEVQLAHYKLLGIILFQLYES